MVEYSTVGSIGEYIGSLYNEETCDGFDQMFRLSHYVQKWADRLGVDYWDVNNLRIMTNKKDLGSEELIDRTVKDHLVTLGVKAMLRAGKDPFEGWR